MISSFSLQLKAGRFVSFLAALVLVAWYVFTPLVTQAAALTGMSNTMTSQRHSTASNHTIVFTTPSGVAAGQTMTITFPSGFVLTGITHSDLDLLDDSTQLTLGASASGATWGVGVSGQVITITSGTGTIAASSVVEIRIGTNATHQTTGTNQITNPGSGTSAVIAIAGTFGDTGNITVPLLANDTVSVNATVQQSITFTLGATSIAFGTLSPSNGRWANTTTGSASEVSAHDIVVGTNAASGYALTVRGATLNANAGANTIAAIGGTAVASNPGTEQFGLRFTASGGSGTVTAPYNTANYAYDATATTSDQIASATGVTANTTYSAHYLANISSNTAAGEYSTALTYVATANY